MVCATMCAHRLKAALFLSVHSSQVLLSGYFKSTASDELATIGTAISIAQGSMLV